MLSLLLIAILLGLGSSQQQDANERSWKKCWSCACDDEGGQCYNPDDTPDTCVQIIDMKCRGTQRDCKCCIGTQGPMCGVGSGVIGCADAYSGTCRTFCAEGESEETRADCGEDPCACCTSNRRSQTCTPTYECVSSAEMCTGTVDTENICDCFSSSFCCVTGLENCDGTELKHGDVNKLDATDSSTLHHK